MFQRRNLIVGASAFALGLLGALLYLREPTVPLTHSGLDHARGKWARAGIRSYRATYRMHGSTYDVQVHDGFITGILVNGQTLSIAQPGAYSIDGLFDTLAAELENIHDPSNPLGTPAGNVVARVRFDETLGYPLRYIRGGTGLSRGSTLEMLDFQPSAP